MGRDIFQKMMMMMMMTTFFLKRRCEVGESLKGGELRCPR